MKCWFCKEEFIEPRCSCGAYMVTPGNENKGFKDQSYNKKVKEDEQK